MYGMVTGVTPHPMPFTVTCAPAGSEVIRNAPSVSSASATLTVSGSFGEAAGSVTWSMSPAAARTVSVAATRATAGASASAIGAVAACARTSAAGAVVPARYQAVATAATAPRTTRAALDHNAVENEDERTLPWRPTPASRV